MSIKTLVAEQASQIPSEIREKSLQIIVNILGKFCFNLHNQSKVTPEMRCVRWDYRSSVVFLVISRCSCGEISYRLPTRDTGLESRLRKYGVVFDNLDQSSTSLLIINWWQIYMHKISISFAIAWKAAYQMSVLQRRALYIVVLTMVLLFTKTLILADNFTQRRICLLSVKCCPNIESTYRRRCFTLVCTKSKHRNLLTIISQQLSLIVIIRIAVNISNVFVFINDL